MIHRRFLRRAAAAAVALAPVPSAAGPMPGPVALTAPGPQGPLAGTLLDPGGARPVVVILPGSGPTDRDGNSPLGITAASYRLLAEALAGRGIATVRVDKRGMFGSAAALADANAVTIADYAADALGWAREAAARTGNRCAWLLGHSEGVLVALTAAAGADPDGGLCGVILLEGPGRPLGTVLREQFRANPANAAILPAALAAIESLEGGRRVDAATLPPPLNLIFNDRVQPFLMDLMATDPAALARRVRLPMLIVSGARDLQIAEADAAALAAAQPAARTVRIDGMNHVLKLVDSDDRAANMAAYADPSRPVAPALVDAVADFIALRQDNPR